jgi:N4-gp56 family major capsid protein
VVINGIGLSQVPPAAPASTTGVVYPTFIFGRGAYAQISLDELKITALLDPDKSDPLNQLRVVGWKVFYGTMLTNQMYMMRIESTSNFSATFG